MNCYPDASTLLVGNLVGETQSFHQRDQGCGIGSASTAIRRVKWFKPHMHAKPNAANQRTRTSVGMIPSAPSELSCQHGHCTDGKVNMYWCINAK